MEDWLAKLNSLELKVMNNIEVDLDGIIEKLLEARGKPGKQINLGESDITFLCVKSRDIFMSQSILLELEAPLKICGTFPFQMRLEESQRDPNCSVSNKGSAIVDSLCSLRLT